MHVYMAAFPKNVTFPSPRPVRFVIFYYYQREYYILLWKGSKNLNKLQDLYTVAGLMAKCPIRNKFIRNKTSRLYSYL